MKVGHRSGAGYDVPYSRGDALALWADATIRERSGGKSSLDDAMFDLVQEGRGAHPPVLTEERIFAALARYLGPEDMAKLRAVLDDGADVPLPARLGKCAELETATQTVVDAGFDETASFRSKRMTGVDPKGAAYAAGIRDGQELFRWSIYHDDPTKKALLGVMVDGERKMIQYSPAKQVVLMDYRAEGGDGAAGCTPF
jgi:predicted metalloprotease with PDZ domain